MELLGGSYGETKLVFEKGGFPSLAKLTLNNLKQLKELRLLLKKKTNKELAASLFS